MELNTTGRTTSKPLNTRRVIYWEGRLEELIESQEGRNRVDEAWDLCRKTKVTATSDRDICKKKITERSRGWWSTEVEEAIQARKAACKELREARRREAQDGTVRKK